jgi:pyruvate, water dikinase
MPKFTYWFKEIDKSDLSFVGEKAAALGELYNADLPIPNGFVITPSAYQHFLKETKLDIKIRHLLSTANVNHLKSLHQVSEIIKKMIMESTLPDDLLTEILNTYKKLGEPLVSIEFASESNQNEAILNVKGDAVLLDKIKFSWSKNFNPKEIFIKYGSNFETINLSDSLIIQQMIVSEKTGILYSGDFKDNTYESIEGTEKLNNEQINELKALAEKVKNHFYFPQKIEWALDNNKFYILQSLPITKAQESSKPVNTDIVLSGIPVNKGIASGTVKIALSKEDAESTTADDILVVKDIKSFFLPAFKKASAVIIENFEKNIQILFDSNELKLPCIANAAGATEILKQGEVITVNCSKGEIYKGGLSITHNKHNLNKTNGVTATKLYLKYENGNSLPDEQLKTKTEGVLISNANKFVNEFGIHPKTLITEHKEQKFIDALADHLSSICREFNDKPVIYQFSNLTTNEYRNLEGGSYYEDEENDASIGFRGAFRFIHQPEVLDLEIKAINKTRDEFNCKNLWVTIPYIRTPEELNEVKQILKNHNLTHSENFKILMTVDIPSNIIELEKFIEIGLDGILVNYGFLNSLLTGTGNKNYEINTEVNRFDNSLLWAFEQIIKTATKFNLSVTVFDENSVNIHSLIDDLIPMGIHSVCLSAENLEQGHRLISEVERRFAYSRV